ncbi:TetR-like C-terminal domain-containing protein [Fodinibacter luteus]|uniref:TetR/AcrR family transcriptional regulator n=1 Tax=Fodinibacter luteus TaxID=552064 RepID=UPI0031EAD376
MTASDDEDRLESKLLRAALQRLANIPAEQLSLRRVAHDVGVSHQAPYVHFGSRRRFLAAVAGTGMAQATEQARAVLAAATDRPPDRLHALAEAYLAFIREQPHLHDLANGPTVAKADHPLLQQAAIEYWGLLHDTVAACQPHRTAEAEILRRAAVTWSTVYGISRLSAFGQIPASVPATADELIHGAIDQLIAGWHHGGGDPSQDS